MKKLILIQILLIFVFFTHAQVANISGNWVLENDASQKVTITQNQQYLTFVMSNSTSSGYFTSANQLFATEWNAYGTLSADARKITWNNQVWIRPNNNTIISTLNIAGKYYIDGNSNQVAEIKQNGQNLTFIMSNTSSAGYFSSSHAVYATDWNAPGTIHSDGSISWSNQKWVKTTPASQSSSASGRQCRLELSMFYAGSQAIGSVWGRLATSPSPLPNVVINDCRSALTSLRAGLDNMTCVDLDRSLIDNLDNQLPAYSAAQAVAETEKLIKKLQEAVNIANPNCDSGVKLYHYYVAGVHMGAAQAWAASRMCLAAPMPGNIAATINAHLQTASNSLREILNCLPYFDINIMGTVPVNSALSTQPHTHIVGIQTQILWNIAMSDCCCDCIGNVSSSHQTESADPCDKDCQEYCRSQGKRHGKYNGRTPCLLGLVEQPAAGCDCRD